MARGLGVSLSGDAVVRFARVLYGVTLHRRPVYLGRLRTVESKRARATTLALDVVLMSRVVALRVRGAELVQLRYFATPAPVFDCNHCLPPEVPSCWVEQIMCQPSFGTLDNGVSRCFFNCLTD